MASYQACAVHSLSDLNMIAALYRSRYKYGADRLYTMHIAYYTVYGMSVYGIVYLWENTATSRSTSSSSPE